MMDLSPIPLKPGKEILWATKVPGRHPEFKTYSNRGHALNAVNAAAEGHREVVLYVLEEGFWMPKVYVPIDKECSVCHNTQSSGFLSYIDHKVKPQFLSKKRCSGCWGYEPANRHWPMDKFLLDPDFQYYR